MRKIIVLPLQIFSEQILDYYGQVITISQPQRFILVLFGFIINYRINIDFEDVIEDFASKKSRKIKF
jgi:hypothetical protein